MTTFASAAVNIKFCVWCYEDSVRLSRTVVALLDGVSMKTLFEVKFKFISLKIDNNSRALAHNKKNYIVWTRIEAGREKEERIELQFLIDMRLPF
jgi:hypothetical protein